MRQSVLERRTESVGGTAPARAHTPRRKQAVPRHRRALATGLFAVAVLLLTGTGVLVTVGAVAPHRATYRGPLLSGPGPFPIATPIRGASAVLEVVGVDQLGGLSPQDLSSANHGIQNLVAPEDAQIQVTMRVTNDGRSALAMADQHFGLRINGKKAIPAMSSTLPTGTLGAGLTVEGSLGFVAPRNGSKLELEVSAPTGPALVELGRTDKSVGPSSGSHHH